MKRLALTFLSTLLAVTAAAYGQGFVIVSGDDADDSGHCQGTRCGGLYPTLLQEGLARSQSGGVGILAVGVNSGNALSALNGWNSPANGGPGAPVTHVRATADIATVNFADFALVYIPSVSFHTSGGISSTQVAALNSRQPDIADYVNQLGGSLIALTQANTSGGWGFLPVPLETLDQSFTTVTPTAALQALSPATTQGNLSHCCFHNVFTGPPEFSGLDILAVRTDTGLPVMLGGVGTILTAEICNDGIDNDGDGLIDREDPDCRICGDGIVDPGEECDDGNTNDGDGCSASCQLEDNLPPVAICQSSTLETELGVCSAAPPLDAGSYDPEGAPLTLVSSPPPPYAPGAVPATLTATDPVGAAATCDATLTVVDAEPPRGLCNAPAALDGAIGSASFTATALDNCPVAIAIGDPSCRDDDVDDDGVPDDRDECPDSDLSDTVAIVECETGVINVLFETGCTISDLILICGVEARNHGEFVSCVAHLTNELKSDGVITGAEKGVIQRCAAQSPIPEPRGPQEPDSGAAGSGATAGAASTDPTACPVEVNAATLAFPDLPGIGLLTWTATATDDSGNSVTESCRVEVQNPATSFFNLPPAADAGPDQVALLGATVALDGSASLDLDGDPLAFQWALESAPAGSAAALADADTAAPSLVVDLPGTYVARLVVSDGADASEPDRVAVRAGNRRPVANAGADHMAILDDTVTFDGTGSLDPDGDPISFAWTLAVQPAGSAATLSDPTAASPQLTADRRGVYVAQLVVDDGALASPIDAAILFVRNVPPVADAGPDQDISVFDTVQLDGSGSSDFEGDPLTFSWTLLSGPAGTTATLSDPSSVDPTFVADLAGIYLFELVVNDGFDPSAPDTVSIVTVNTPPVADAGPNQVAFLDDLVRLDGSGSSDVDGDPLTFEWTVVFQPAGSSATLSDPTAVDPFFVADVRGSYAFELVVFDGQRFSQPDRVTVAVINRAPMAVVRPTLNAGVTYPVVLDAGASFDPDGDPITFSWAFASRPPTSSAALSRETTPRPFFTPDVAGEYVARATVSDGSLSGTADVTVTAVAANSPPNADAGRDRTVLVGQSVRLDGRRSSDPEGDALTFVWSFRSVPAGSALTDFDLVGADTATPTFAPDTGGIYEIIVTVDDGLGSDQDDVTVTAVTANAPPHADPGPDQAAPGGSTILLDGSASFDPDSAPAPLGFEWSLISVPAGSALTSADLVTPDSPSAAFTPDVAGLYVVRLEVDDGAFADAANVVVHIDDAPPGISFTAPGEGQIFYSGTIPSFALTYFDQESGLDLGSFQLVVAGVDVTADTQITTTGASHTPAAPLAPGNYTSEASIADRAGNAASTSRAFRISSDVFRAIADCSPTSGVVPLTVRFRSRGEFSGGSIIRYRWDFEGDGRFDTSDPVARDFTRTFDTGGIRAAVLEVTNNFGERVTDTCVIDVSGTPPVVVANANPSNGPVPLTVDFTCDATDPDGTVALYEWDFEGDGTFDFSSPTSGAVTHVYPAVGTFPAVCRVTDGDGLVTVAPTINTTVHVLPPGSPSVTAIATPTAGDAPLAVAFDGTAVDDGTIVLWEWDFEGDGVFDFSAPTSPATSFTYGDGGVFGATLRVTDDSGLTATDAVQIDVGVAVTLAIPDDTFEPAAGETVSIESTLSGGTPVRLFVRDDAGDTRRVLFDGFRAAGAYSDAWDGTDEGGLPLAHGPYFVILEYESAGAPKTLDLTNTTGGVRYNPPRGSLPRTFSPFEDDLLDINFTIPAARGASEVTAFVGLFNVDTRFVTLLERVPFGAGSHTIHWDGTAPSGGVATPPPGDRFLFGLFGFTQPDNAVMIEAAPNIFDVSVDPNFFDPSTPDFISPDDPMARITYSLDKTADVELTVTNLVTGVTLRTIVDPAVAPGAGLTIDWDGRADSGLFADRGDYRLTLRAIDSEGNASINRFALVRVFY